MRYLFITILVLMLAGSQLVIAQSKKKKGNSKANEAGGQPSSLAPYYQEKVKEPAEPKRKKPKGKITYNARDKFYDRIEEVAKANRKAEKELKKPQYSDPSYFGHKRPPKRRPAGKLKYCKECGLRH